MREIVISNEVLRRSRKNSFFIPLVSDPENIDLGQVRSKILEKNTENIPEIWGTLGMADIGAKFNMSGTLLYSAIGNEHGSGNENGESSGERTLVEIGLFRENTVGREVPKKRAFTMERAISFEGVEFMGYPPTIETLDDIPKLRLDLFLNQDEGAVAFLQYRNRNSEHDKWSNNEIDYILPLETDDYNCTERDRLTYHIPILPPSETNYNEETGTFNLTENKQEVSMVLKVLTGKRMNKQNGQPAVRDKDYQLLEWDGTDFQKKDNIDFQDDEKVLFLIHGTFSSTEGAFAELIKDGRNSWLNKFVEAHKYAKVIGFDHPTISAGPEDNANELKKWINGNANVDIITHSRGALFGKYTAHNFANFRISRGVHVGGANGVGYFTAGKYVATFLKIYKLIDPSLVASMAQYSASWFLNQPGCRAMTPGSIELNHILNPQSPPAHSGPNPSYSQIVGNCVGHKGWWQRGLDLIIMLFLGKEHDRVVGSTNQAIYAPGDDAGKEEVDHIHTDYFRHDDVKQAIEKGLP